MEGLTAEYWSDGVPEYRVLALNVSLHYPTAPFSNMCYTVEKKRNS